MDVVSVIVIIVLVPLLLISYANRNKPDSKFGPTVCSTCGVELRGWKSSGKKQLWTHTDDSGRRTHFCAACRNKALRQSSRSRR